MRDPTLGEIIGRPHGRGDIISRQTPTGLKRLPNLSRFEEKGAVVVQSRYHLNADAEWGRSGG